MQTSSYDISAHPAWGWEGGFGALDFESWYFAINFSVEKLFLLVSKLVK